MLRISSETKTNQANAFLSPAYWGSLASFLLGLFGVLMISLWKGPPDYLMPMPTVQYGEKLVFYSTLVIVVLFVVRYYSAVSVQLYGGSETSIFRMPRQFRKMMFWFLCLLVFLSGINAFLIGIVGVVPALIVCVVQSGISLLCVGALWVGRQFRPERVKEVELPFTVGEVFFLFPVLYLLVQFTAGSGSTDSDGIAIGFVVALVFFFSLQEWMRIYAHRFRDQFEELLRILDSEAD